MTARGASQRLGGAVFELLAVIVTELLEQGVSLIVEGNFTDQTRLFTALPPCQVAQVHVSASPATLRARLRGRGGQRHPVHYDHEAANEIAARATAGEWDPLRLAGVLVRVDTTDGFDADVPAQLAQALKAANVTLF